MTHEELVRAVYEKQIATVNCIKGKCEGYNCEECSENLVREYENKIREDFAQLLSDKGAISDYWKVITILEAFKEGGSVV